MTADGFKPDPEKIKAISTCRNRKANKICNAYLAWSITYHNTFQTCRKSRAPLRALLTNNTQWVWYDEHRSAIDKLKHVLMNSRVLQYFNPDKLITIQTDASKSGIGSCLLQEGHPVIYASRLLTTAEQNYAQIEKELLAIVFACE